MNPKKDMRTEKSSFDFQGNSHRSRLQKLAMILLFVLCSVLVACTISVFILDGIGIIDLDDKALMSLAGSSGLSIAAFGNLCRELFKPQPAVFLKKRGAESDSDDRAPP